MALYDDGLSLLDATSCDKKDQHLQGQVSLYVFVFIAVLGHLEQLSR